MYALLIEHRTRSGQRDNVERTWQEHMQPAIAANAGHVAYAYTFGQDDDVITAFQIYTSQAEAEAFLRQPSYGDYLAASRSMLAGEPKVSVLDVRWLKSASADV